MSHIHQQAMARSIVSLGALLLTSAAACSSLTDPGRTPSSLTVKATSGSFPPAAPTVLVTESAITIDGVIATPTPCYAVSGGTSTAHDTLVVRVVAKSTLKAGGTCEAMVGLWHYVLTVSPRPARLSAVRVVHAGGVGKETVVLEQGIATP